MDSELNQHASHIKIHVLHHYDGSLENNFMSEPVALGQFSQNNSKISSHVLPRPKNRNYLIVSCQ